MSPDELNRIDLNLLVAFNALMDERSVSRAAERLHVTQPAMSKTLQRLRDLFDDRLFIRTPKGLDPTPRSLELQPLVSAALLQLIKLVTPAEFDPKVLDRTFTLAVADPIAARLIPTLVNRLAVAAPGVALRLRGYTGESFQSLSNGTLDFVCGLVQENLPAGAHARLLLQDDICCLVRAGHPLAGQARMTIEQFVAYEHIKPWFRGINDKGLLDLKLKEMGLSRTIRLESSHTLTILRTLQCTDTLVVGMSSWANLVEGGDLVRVGLPDLFERFFGTQASMHLIWDERNHSDPAHRWLRQLMVDVASEETGHLSFSVRDRDA